MDDFMRTRIEAYGNLMKSKMVKMLKLPGKWSKIKAT